MTSAFLCSQDGCTPVHTEPQQPPHPVSDKTSAKLKSVLADEIADIVKDGVDIPTLQQLHRFANVAQELLMVRSPLAEVRRRNRPGMSGSTNFNSGITIGGPSASNSIAPYQTSYGVDNDDCDFSLTQEASPNETYGAKLIREIVPALSGLKNGGKKSKVEALVSAIAEAKESGLDNVVETLELKLHELLLTNKYLEEVDEELHQEGEASDIPDEPEDTNLAIGPTPEWATSEPPQLAISAAPLDAPPLSQPSPGAP